MTVLRTWHVTEPRPVGSGIMIQDSLCAAAHCSPLTAHRSLLTAHCSLIMGCVCSQSFATKTHRLREKPGVEEQHNALRLTRTMQSQRFFGLRSRATGTEGTARKCSRSYGKRSKPSQCLGRIN